MEKYDVAQICLNGHTINGYSTQYPASNQKFCEKCGAEVVSQCLECGQNIRGDYIGSISTKEFTIPLFCIYCGKPFPWTKSKIEAAHEIVKELAMLSDEEKAILNNSINEIIKETPKTGLEATKFKRIMKKVGNSAGDILTKVLSSIISETAKKIIWGS